MFSLLGRIWWPVALIKELRQALNEREESYREVARAIGINHSLLLKFADGKKNIGLENAEKLAEYLGLRLKSK